MTRVALVVVFLLAPAGLAAQTADSVRFYTALVEQNPTDSRAIYRLAALKPRGSAESIALLQRYTALEPEDAWGFLALAEAQAAAGQLAEARSSLAIAERLAPGEEDVDVVRARVRRAARATAPSVQPRISFTRDSDANELLQLNLAADIASSATTRWGAAVTRSSVGDGIDDFTADEARASLNVRTARTRLELSAGAARLASAAEFTTAVARARLRWQQSAGGALVDVRATRAPVLVSPLLMANQVVLTEARGTVELPVAGALRVRGVAQAADLRSVEFETTSHNSRIGIGGALVARASTLTEFAATYYQLSYDAPTTAGYFAPRLVQIAEIGSYFEVYRLDPVSIAADVGGGLQRVGEHGSPAGDWSFVARGWGQVTVPLSQAFELGLEAEAYTSQVNLVATSRSWSSTMAAVGVKWTPPGLPSFLTSDR